MRSRQTGVVLKHEDLQFCPFEEKVALLGGLVVDLDGTVPKIVTGYMVDASIISATTLSACVEATYNHRQ